jgi:predicted permease
VEGRPLEIVGVAPEWFTGLEVGNRFDIAVPLCGGPLLGAGSEARADVFSLNVLARLNPGATVGQASEHVLAFSRSVFDATAPSGYSAKSIERYRNFRLEAVPAANGVSFLRDQYDRALELLFGITALVLVLACANLANLTLARAAARGREFAVRLALGASRSRLARACLSESLLLALLGAGGGLLLANVFSRAIATVLRPPDNPLTLDLTLDWRILFFSIAAAAVACVIFGLAPALRAVRVDPGVAIKAGGRGTTGDRAGFRFQRALVVAQVAVSLMLVVGALLFVRSFRNLLTLDPGFRTEGVLLAYFDAGKLKLPPSEIRPFHERLLNDVRSVPQVESAASTTNIPIGGGSWSLGVRAPGGDGSSKFTWVSPDYFRTLAIPILAGRGFGSSDSEGAPKVVVVNRRFAARFFGKENPIGKRFWTAEEPRYPRADYEIVGLIPDSRYLDLRADPPPLAYAPWNQHPSLGPWAPIFIHSTAPLASVRTAVQERVSRAYPAVEIDFRVLEEQVRGGLLRDRLMASLAGFFGVLAALVASLGLYGVMAYFVVRRRNEIGIRIALGAGRAQVASLVLKDALRMLATGVVLGSAAALALGRTASSLLFGLKASDPATFAAAAALLALAAGFGTLLPARRAAALDPMVALRHD